jgi:hypothetical protein
MGEHMHRWKWADEWYFCLGCGLRRTEYPLPSVVKRLPEASPHVHVGRWCSACLVIAHDLREYARHESGCAFQGASGPTCDCGFDQLLERYDRLSPRRDVATTDTFVALAESDYRSLLHRILTSREYGRMEAEGLAADALGLRWSEAQDGWVSPDDLVEKGLP